MPTNCRCHNPGNELRAALEQVELPDRCPVHDEPAAATPAPRPAPSHSGRRTPQEALTPAPPDPVPFDALEAALAGAVTDGHVRVSHVDQATGAMPLNASESTIAARLGITEP